MKSYAIDDFSVPNLTGVYALRHKPTGKIYVGATNWGFRNRLSSHVILLRKGTHANPKLQEIWEKDGENSFEFLILEVCEFAALQTKEAEFIKKHDSIENGFNLEGATKIKLSSGRKYRCKTDKKLSSYHIQKIRAACSTPEARQRMSLVKRGLIPKLTEKRFVNDVFSFFSEIAKAISLSERELIFAGGKQQKLRAITA